MKTLSHVLILLFASLSSATISTSATLSGFTEVAGITKDYTIKDKDGLVDFSLVIPAMTVEELMNFDLGRIVSPENDTLSIATKSFEIPSNLSLPKQTESYFLSFTIQKPDFRAYVKDMGEYNLYALHGQFPLKKVIDGVQGGQSLFEMVNFFAFKGGGSESIEVKGPTKDVKIGITEWSFPATNSITVPKIAAGKEVLSFALFKIGDELYPSDIKRVLSGKTEKLVNRSGVDNYVLSVLVNSSQQMLAHEIERNGGDITASIFGERASFDMNQISYTIQKAGSTAVTASFLPQFAAPTYANGTLSVSAPKPIADVNPYATLVVLSEVTTAGSANLPLDFKNVVWSLPTMGWVHGNVTPPASVVNGMKKGQKYSWEVLYLGSTSAVSSSTIDWNQVSHVTRNSVSVTP